MQQANTSKEFHSKRLAAVSFLFLTFFGLGWWSLSSSSPTFPSEDVPVVLYANQTGTNLQLLFCQAMSQAKQSIFLEMYAFTDPTLIKLLHAKARGGLSVNILTDRKASPGLKKKLPPSVNLRVHKGRGLMHRKTLVIDHQITFLGSVNFTTPSLTLHDNFALAVSDRQFADFFENEGQQAEFHHLKDQTIEAWKLPKKGLAAREKILSELANAKKSIYLAMFTLTDPDLTNALIAAHNRGVRVFLAVDYYTAGGSSKQATEKLAKAGIILKTSLGAQLLHHKWALIDGTTLITGSTNWTKSAFAHNHDNFVIIHNLTEKQQKLMLQLWRCIDRASRSFQKANLVCA